MQDDIDNDNSIEPEIEMFIFATVLMIFEIYGL